ncbi:MAG: hypothetical protein ACOY0S_02555 [Patescibacteria group bacterium]
MEKFFATLGKIGVFLVLVAAVIAGSFLLGKRSATFLAQKQPPTPSPQLSITPTPLPKKLVTAGLGNPPGINFPRYTIEVPTSWTVTQEHSEEASPMDQLTVSRDGYRLKIFQAATGGSICLYPGDAAVEGPSVAFANFVEITTSEGLRLRRSGTTALSPEGNRGFTICHFSRFGSWEQPTPFGHISLQAPADFSSEIIREMDTMVTSLKKL